MTAFNQAVEHLDRRLAEDLDRCDAVELLAIAHVVYGRFDADVLALRDNLDLTYDGMDKYQGRANDTIAHTDTLETATD